MKCANPTCYKEAYPRQKYCSIEHAPYAKLLGDKDGSPSVQGKIKKSGSGAHGEISHLSCEKEKLIRKEKSEYEPNESVIQIGIQNVDGSESNSRLQSSDEMKTDDIGNEPNQPESFDGESGTDAIKLENGKRSNNGESTKTLSMVSQASLNRLEEAKETSAILLNESIEQLKKLMTSIKAETPEHINAACNCAKQIHNLLRLKLDIWSASRK